MTTSATSPSGACSTEPIVRSRAIRLLHASGPRLIDLLLDRRYIAGQAHPDAFSESLQRRMRDECLNENLVFSINHARAIVAGWVETFNTGRPHSAIGYMNSESLRCDPETAPGIGVATPRKLRSVLSRQ